LYVPNAAVKEILTPADAVRLARETLLQMANYSVDWATPRQTNLVVGGSEDGDYPAHLSGGTVYKIKGCALREIGVAGFRVVGLNRSEEGYAVAGYRPTKNVLLSDANTGALFGIVDERWAYGLRTGACAAVALGALARTGATDFSLIGTGPMGFAAALAVNEVMPLKTVRVHSRDPERRAAFADRLSDAIGLTVEPVADPESCLRDAGAVVTVTTAKEPFLKHEWLSPGAAVYAMGGGHEWERACYDKMRVVVDDREQCKIVTEIRKWIADGTFDPLTDVEADLPEVVAGRAGQRTSDEDQFLVRSQGLVTQDVAQAYWVYNQAVERGLGVDLEHALVERPGDSLF
jgi:ornithine cyclodeaminase/alanine dehydrogenase-like protein (mu-crystallin family)